MFFNDDLIAVLHVARVGGIATPERVAHVLAVDECTIDTLLNDAVERGLLRHRATGAMAGWSLTPEGREMHSQRVKEALDRCTFVDHLTAADDAFVELNRPFKELCTRWQLEGHPASCITELGPIHERVVQILNDLAAVDHRFGIYAQRFAAAFERLGAGDATALTKPLSGSYHDVWMELHQDLILTAGRERSTADGH